MRWSSPDGRTPPTAPGGRETQTRRQSGTAGGEGVAPPWSSTSKSLHTLAKLRPLSHSTPEAASAEAASAAARPKNAGVVVASITFGAEQGEKSYVPRRTTLLFKSAHMRLT